MNVEDKSYFYRLMKEICMRTFSTAVIPLPDGPIIHHPPVLIFGDFMQIGTAVENKVYEEIENMEKVKCVLQDSLKDYNRTASKEMKLIFFTDAIEHVARLARVLRMDRGNALLVGVCGMGKQSLARLGAHLCGHECFQLELTYNYDYNLFLDDMRRLYFNAGVKNEDTTFLFTDGQIVQEEFLEDISNILNSGEIPNLYEAAEEYEKVIQGMRASASCAGVSQRDRDGIFTFFLDRVKCKLHIVLCMSPVGDAFRRRCRMFPPIVNCCAIDWFMDWPHDALLSVARDVFQPLGDEEFVNDLANTCVVMHESVTHATARFYEEMRRHCYATASSYVEFIKLYKTMLKKKKDELNKKKDKISNGLKKLFETKSVLDKMKADLVALEPELMKKSAAAAHLMKHLLKQQSQADKLRQIVLSEEAVVKTRSAETQVLADDAQRDRDAVMPAMEAAIRALESLNKNDINELQVLNKPPNLVKFVMEAVCLLLGKKMDWASARLVLGDTNLIKKLREYEKDKISDSLLKKLKEYVEHPDFLPEQVATQSKVCRSMCMWVRATDMYAKVCRVMEPKRRRLEEAEKELTQIMSVLREKQQHLAEVEKKIADVETSYDAIFAEKTELERVIDVTAKRLTRAGRLTSALSDEQIQWEQLVNDVSASHVTAVGDVLVAAGCVAYLGPFTSAYRDELMGLWISHCKELSVPTSNIFSLVAVLTDQYEIRQWNKCGLPGDRVSAENAVIVTHARRWPLFIDPQEQANKWIRQMESANLLKVVKLTDSNFMHVLEGGIRTGNPVLLEGIGETLDPTLSPVLLKQKFFQGARTLIRLGDTDIEYDNNFRFYMTTRLPNPHYLPEICIQVTLVNFTATQSGLEDQLLSDVVHLEQPDLEQQRNELITKINNDKNELQNIEDKILRMLYTSEGDILDDNDLINTLNESKETSAIVASRLEEMEAAEGKISVVREKYRLVATRGSVLYFVVAQLADIDFMYQYSLKYFIQVFNKAIDNTEKVEDLAVRLKILLDEITLAVYANVSRGLFERHKLVFSFMLCTSIFKQAGIINERQWNFLLRRPSVGMTVPKKPDVVTLSDAMWLSVNFLAANFNNFEGLVLDAVLKIYIRIEDFEQVINIQVTNQKAAQTDWNTKLDNFEKLMLLKALKEEKLVSAIASYVKGILGHTFVESPQITLQKLYQDTSNVIPLLFMLNAGSDPFEAFKRFASDMGYGDRVRSVSLGQGQGPVAEKMISLGVAKGEWVFLQNCHLAASWMLPMERIIQKLSETQEKVHPDFRLYLSAVPSKAFPVSILQNSVKATNESPRGLRASMKRAFLELTTDVFEDHPLGPHWRKMIFGMCFFHAVIQERKKFGPLGWNVTYEFNDTDWEYALNTMKMFCADASIPWVASEYITGEITYGGRVADYWDLRCLKTILKDFFAPHTLLDGYLYSDSGVYYCPESRTCSTLAKYMSFIDELPLIEEPEIFGMHENANIAFQVKETRAFLMAIMEIQPRESSGSVEKSSDDIVYQLSETILGKITESIDADEYLASLLWRDEKGRIPSLSAVLFQEVDRYNRLLTKVCESLRSLQKAIKGLVVMSEEMEDFFKSCLNNQVPKMWGAISYPSLKSLGSWIQDLQLRLDFIKVWVRGRAPPSYWLSGFYFPQSFLTAVLQTHSRKYDLAIDELKFDFVVLEVILDQKDIYAAHMENDQCEVPEAYRGIVQPEDGVIVHGLFLDAGRWDNEQKILVDPNPGEINPPLPAMHMLPKSKIERHGIRYLTPLYKTSVRAGILSTTGHSTNFLVAVLLPSSRQESHWIRRGTALLTQITD